MTECLVPNVILVMLIVLVLVLARVDLLLVLVLGSVRIFTCTKANHKF